MNAVHSVIKQPGALHHGTAVKASVLQEIPEGSDFADAMQQACAATNTDPQANPQQPEDSLIPKSSQGKGSDVSADVCVLDAGGAAGFTAERLQRFQLPKLHKDERAQGGLLHAESGKKSKGNTKTSQQASATKPSDAVNGKDSAQSIAIKMVPAQSPDVQPNTTDKVIPDSGKTVDSLAERNGVAANATQARCTQGHVPTGAPVVAPASAAPSDGSISSAESQSVEAVQIKGAEQVDKLHDSFAGVLAGVNAGGGSQAQLTTMNPRAPQLAMLSLSAPTPNVKTSESLVVRYETSTPRQLEVAVAGGELGSVSVRAELKNDGSVHAMLRGTGETLSELRDRKGELQSFLSSESIAVREISIENAKPVVAVPSAMSWSSGGNGAPAGEQQQRRPPTIPLPNGQGKQGVATEIVSESLPASSRSGTIVASSGGWLSVRV